MLLLMRKRKARKSLFSSDDARRNSARVELETEDERCERLRIARERMAISRSQDTEERSCVLRRKRWLFPEVRIPKNVDIFVYEMMQ